MVEELMKESKAKQAALEEAEQWMSKCMEAQKHEVPMEVQNAGPSASSCKKKQMLL